MPRLKAIIFTLFFVAIIGIGMPLVVAESNAITILTPEIVADKTLVDVGEEVTFTAIGTYGDEVELIWVFHDGSEPNTTIAGDPGGLELTHAFPTEGVFLVSLFANAPGWSPLPDTVEIQVLNYRPSAYIEGPTEAIEDSLVTFLGDSSTDTPTDIATLTYYWTLGDGNTADGEIIEHSWSEAGEYPITLYVIDDQGALDMKTVFLTILNCPPLAAFTTDGIIEDDTILVMEDEALLFDALSSWDTPTDLEELRYYWDFGDETVANDPVISHTYRKSGTFEVTLLVMDDDGEQSETSATVQVTNYDPSVDITVDEVILHEGETYVFVADSWDSPSDYPILNYNWEFGESGWRASNFWMDDWTGDIQLIVEDDDEATASDSVHVTVLNQPPHVWIEQATVTCNISLRIDGNKWQTINLTIGHDGQVVQFDSLPYQLSDPPGLGPPTEIPPKIEYNITNFIFNLDYLWKICLDYESEVKAGNTQVWLTLAFANGYDIDIPLTFKNQDPDTWHWCLHPNYFFGHAPINILVSMFDPGGDPFLLEVTGGVDSHDILFHQQYYPAVYPALQIQSLIITPVEYWPPELHNVESLSKILNKLKKQDYTFGLRLDVLDFDGGHSITEVTFLLTYDYGLLIQGAGPTTQIIALPSSIIEDELIEFQAVTISPSFYDDTPNYTWHFGDGTSVLGQTATHTFSNKGTYLIRLHVTDSTSTKVYYHLLEVINPEPRPQSSQTHYEVAEDDIIQFDATESTDTESDNTQLRFFWDFGDGATSSTSETSHAYAHDGMYTITIQITDDNGAKALETREVTVLNQPPQILGPTAFSAAEGEVMPIEVAIKDSITDEPNLSFSWEINGEIISNKRFAIWKDDGIYAAELTIEDSDQEVASVLVQIAVDNIKPEVLLPPVNAYGIPQPIIFHAFAIDAFTDFDDLNFEWYVNGEYPSGISHSPWSTLVNEFEFSGEYHITVEVEDETNHKDSIEFISIVIWDQDGDGIPDEEDTGDDLDGDGLTDYEEIHIYLTDPENVDSDNDGLWDGIEVFGWNITALTAEGRIRKYVNSNPLSLDTDSDGLMDGEEYNFRFNPQRADTDGDGLTDLFENQTLGTDPTNYDSDGDLLEDGEEVIPYKYSVTIDQIIIEKSTTSDPIRADTDGDNLNDYEERYQGKDGYITDARLNDTDSDYALDSAEGFTQDYDLNKRVAITSETDFTLQINTIGQVSKFLVTIGFSNIDTSELSFALFKSDPEPIVTEFVDVSAPIFYKVYDFTSKVTHFSGPLRLSVSVSDKVILDEFSAAVTVFVDPLNDDVDKDGLLDGEELSGEWMTNPLRKDTDQDGWDDPIELAQGTNPLSSDTDADGIPDPQDVNPLRNTLVKVTVQKAHYGFLPAPFLPPHLLVVLTIPSSNTYVTAPRACTLDFIGFPIFAATTAVFNYNYYFDTADNQGVVYLYVQLVHEFYVLPDVLLLEGLIPYNIGTTKSVHLQHPIWPHWVKLTISTSYQSRVNTIAIHSDVNFAEGHYRSLERQYVIILDVLNQPTADSPFQQGINVLTIPRTIFHDTQLHQFIEDEEIPPAIEGATFYGMDDDSDRISQNVEGIISASVTAEKAYAILDLVLRNVTGYEIYSFTVTGFAESLGLPQDALGLIPFHGIVNGPYGAPPVDFWQWLGGIFVGIINAIAIGVVLLCKALIAIGQFILALATAVIEWGMETIATFTEVAVKAIMEVVRLAVIALGFLLGALVRAFFIMATIINIPVLFLLQLQPSLHIEWNFIKLAFGGQWIGIEFADALYEVFPWYSFNISIERGSSPGIPLMDIGLALSSAWSFVTVGLEIVDVFMSAVLEATVNPLVIISLIAKIAVEYGQWITFKIIANDAKAAVIAFFVIIIAKSVGIVAGIFLEGLLSLITSAFIFLISGIYTLVQAKVVTLGASFDTIKQMMASGWSSIPQTQFTSMLVGMALEFSLALANILFFAICLLLYSIGEKILRTLNLIQ